MNNRVFLRHKVTGKTAYYPRHFADRETFERIDPRTGRCLDCEIKKPATKEVKPDAEQKAPERKKAK